MKFPFNHGHNSHLTHHHPRRDDDEPPVNYPPHGNAFNNEPPPPFYGQPPPPQPETHLFHTSHVPSGHGSQDFNYSPPPPPSGHHSFPADPTNYGYPPCEIFICIGDFNVTVHHVSHETHHHTHIHPPVPTSVHHVGHTVTNANNRPTIKVVTKAAHDYALTIRNGQVVLARSNPSDQYQHWYKDEKYSTMVKDKEGCPAFSLVNTVTGEALKHSIGATHPVQLVPYNQDYLDESIMWTQGNDLGDGFRAIRMLNNVHLNVDACRGDKQSGGVQDGTTVILWQWNQGDNQQWKIIPYCKFLWIILEKFLTNFLCAACLLLIYAF